MRDYRGRVLMGFALATAACSANAEGDVTIATVSFQDGVDSYAGSTDTEMREAAADANFGEDATCNADGDDGGGSDKSCLIRWALRARDRSRRGHRHVDG
jgi:hypothetical protein